MSAATKDTTLVIRARSEADRVFREAASAADAFGGRVSQLESKLVRLESSETRAGKSLREVGLALESQAGKLGATSATVEAYKARLAEIPAILENLKRTSAKGFDGPGKFAGSAAEARTQIKALEREFTSLQAKLSGTTGRPGGLEARLAKELEGYRGLRQAQLDLRDAQASVRTSIDQTTEALIRQERALKAADAATTQRNAAAALHTRLNSTINQVGGKSAEASAAVFAAAGPTTFEAAELKAAANAHAAFEARVKAGAAALRAEAAEVDHLRAVLNPAAVAEARLAAETQKLDKWLAAGTISAREHAAALKLVKVDAERAAKAITPTGAGRAPLFGLRPHELQNLSFQMNDIVTQLASGTSLTQALAQQGGQIFQIFPRVGGAIAGAFKSPAALAFLATLGGIVIGISKAASEAERLRDLDTLLLANANSSGASAQGLLTVSKQLDLLGLSADDALAATKALFKEGFNESQIVSLGAVAKDMADVLGIDVAEAAKQLSEALTGSFEAMEKFMDSTQAFTPAQRELIAGLYAQGKAAEGAALAEAIFSGKMSEAAANARGPWGDAFRSLGNLWTAFTEALGDTGWAQSASDALSGLGSLVKDLIDGLTDLSGLRPYVNVRVDVNGQAIGPNNAGDPLNGGYIYDSAGNLIPNPVAAPSSAPATVDQVNAGNKILKEDERRAALEGKITSERDIQARLAAISAQEYEKLGTTVAKAVADQHVGNVLARERVKLEDQLRQYNKQKADEAEREAAAAATTLEQTKRLLMNSEGFKSKAYWDVNAFRVGFGSDTVTRPDGRVERVTAGTNGITRADATRDLERRIKELTEALKGKIGADRFNDFSASQQSAIISLFYNYGINSDRLEKQILPLLKTGTSAQIATGIRGLAGDNGGVNAERRNREAALIDVPNMAVEQSAAAEIEKAKRKQDEFNAALDESIAKRATDTRQLQEQAGLQGDALRAKEREAAIEDAIAKARADAAKAGVDVNSGEFEARIAALRDVEGAYFDVAHARERFEEVRAGVDRPIQELTALRDSLQQQIANYQQAGQTGLANNLQTQLDGVNGQLDQAIAKAREFYASLEPDSNPYGLTKAALDEIALKLEAAKAQSIQWTYVLGISGQQIAQTFAGTATSAIDRFAQAIANGSNAFSSLLDAFLSFAADFLRQIAQMIQQQIIFNLVSGLLQAAGSAGIGAGFGSGAAGATNGFGAVGGVMAHNGGVIGFGGGQPRAVAPAWFANAARYHTGGIAGLRPDEVPAILRRGEEVLTAEDPRHRGNGGASPVVNLKNVNVFDSADVLDKALASKVGEKVMLNFMRTNSTAVKGAIGG